MSTHNTELERLGDEIATLSAQVDVAIARLLTLIREFDDRQGWRIGFRSCADWLAWRVGLDLGAARERVRVARALGGLPLLAAAIGRGEISYAKARAVTRVATRHTEARLLAIARTATAAQVERFVRGWRAEDPDADRREAGRRHESRALHVHHDETGMVVIHGRLDPEAGALFMRALEAAEDALYRRSKPVAPKAPTPPQQRADALALVAEAALHHELDPGAPGERYQVVLHVDLHVRGVRRSWRTAPTFPRKRRSDSVVTPAAQSCGTMQKVALSRSALAPGPFHRPAPGSAPSRPGLSVSRLRIALRPGPPHPSLGPRWTDDPVEPGAPVPLPSSRRARGGVSDHTPGERDPGIPQTGWSAAPRGAHPSLVVDAPPLPAGGHDQLARDGPRLVRAEERGDVGDLRRVDHAADGVPAGRVGGEVEPSPPRAASTPSSLARAASRRGVRSVRVMPGCTQFTVMPKRPSWTARVLLMCTSDVLRAPPLRLPALRALRPLMLMMRPQRCSFMKGMAARAQRSAPTYFTLKSWRRSSSTRPSMGPTALGEPPGGEPLFTRMWSPPSCAAACATMPSTWARLVTSAGMAITRRPVSVGQLARRGLQRVLGAGHDGHVRAFARQLPRDGLADAEAAAGDDGLLALEPEIHGVPPSMPSRTRTRSHCPRGPRGRRTATGKCEAQTSTSRSQ